jgi:IS5 family transposase
VEAALSVELPSLLEHAQGEKAAVIADLEQCGALRENVQGKALVADAGHDADRIIDAIRARGMKPMIVMKPTRTYNRRRLPRREDREKLSREGPHGLLFPVAP